MATGEQVAVSCRAVVRVYGSATEETQALRGIGLELRRHELTVVTGPSGSGKSSLLGLLAPATGPAPGGVEVLGHDLGTAPRRVLRDLRRREVGVRAAADLERSSRARRARPPGPGRPVARRADRPRAGRPRRPLGLGDCVGRAPETLSGGEQQRVTVAMAAGRPPPVVVADEPTAELDHRHAEGVIDACSPTRPPGAARS